MQYNGCEDNLLGDRGIFCLPGERKGDCSCSCDCEWEVVKEFLSLLVDDPALEGAGLGVCVCAGVFFIALYRELGGEGDRLRGDRGADCSARTVIPSPDADELKRSRSSTADSMLFPLSVSLQGRPSLELSWSALPIFREL